MSGSITPLPVMLEEEDRKVYEKLKPPESIVVRYGYMRLIAELPSDGKIKLGCGSKLVITTRRGIEMATQLTSTCPNAGCSHSVTRSEMLQYIENSGGKDYPFTTQGRILRVSTIDDINEQSRLDAKKPTIVHTTRTLIREVDLPMRLVEVELLLGGDRIIFHYTSKQWVDFRELVRHLAAEYQTRIEMHQVNARDEARLVADYEKCGQYCCCKQFLKVLKPVSMKLAKMQKATLDPSKISGRCGRLMCCLRYEQVTYDQLRKLLPHKQSRVKTEDGEGTVVDSQILTQLVLVCLDNNAATQAYAVEDIEVIPKGQARSISSAPPSAQTERVESSATPGRSRELGPPEREHRPEADTEVSRSQAPSGPADGASPAPEDGSASGPKQDQRRPRHRRRKRGD